VVICLERGADLHTAQLMSLPLTVSCFSKIHIGFTSLVPAHLGSPGQRAVKWVCVCVCVCVSNTAENDLCISQGKVATRELDRSVRFSCQIFSGFYLPEIIKIG